MTAKQMYQEVEQDKAQLDADLGGKFIAGIEDHCKDLEGFTPMKFAMTYDEVAEYPMAYWMESVKFDLTNCALYYREHGALKPNIEITPIAFLPNEDLARICDELKITL